MHEPNEKKLSPLLPPSFSPAFVPHTREMSSGKTCGKSDDGAPMRPGPIRADGPWSSQPYINTLCFREWPWMSTYNATGWRTCRRSNNFLSAWMVGCSFADGRAQRLFRSTAANEQR